MTDVVKLTRSEIDEQTAAMHQAVEVRVRAMAIDPQYAGRPRDGLIAEAIKIEFAKRPSLAKAWQDAPGHLGRGA